MKTNHFKFTFILLVLCSCAMDNAVTYKYDYTLGSIGAGPEPTTNLITLKKEHETENISDAIRKAIQLNNLNIINADIDNLKQNISYSTEPIQLTDQEINSYNEKIKDEKTFKLKKGPQYRIHYEIKYILRENSMALVMSMRAILEVQGTGSEKWHNYSKEYLGSYFTNKINESFLKNI